jgi:hypothetical protein
VEGKLFVQRGKVWTDAERHFVDARLRVHSENIGLARLPDRTRLIRVGKALPRELAAWRYGDQMARRRWRNWFGAGTAAVGGTALLLGGVPLMASAAVPVAAAGWALHVAGNLAIVRSQLRPLLRVQAEDREVVLRVQHARFARVVADPEDAGVAVQVPSPAPARREESGGVVRWVPPPDILLRNEDARRFLERTLVSANAWGLSDTRVRSAVDRLANAGGPDSFLRQVGQARAGLFPPWMSNNNYAEFDPRGSWERFLGTFRGERIQARSITGPTQSLPRVEALALEMALQEESERRALQGELAALEAAWREAEEIATIADALPDEPPMRSPP